MSPRLRPPSLSAPLLLLLVFVAMLAGRVPRARAELVYDNSVNDLNVFLTEATEFGDEVDFAGTARTLSSLAFSVFGERDLPAGVRARFRIYRNDGEIPPKPEPQFRPPGTLLYQSDDIPVRTGLQNIRIVDLAIPVPNKVTWTVEFLGMGPQTGERAGLLVYHPPVVGRSFKDYWYRETTGFRLHVLISGVAASFAAQFEALPDPAVSLSAQPGPGGVTVVTVNGPIGSEQVIESSPDQNTWRAVGIVNLSTNTAGTFRDQSGGSATAYYRATRSPYPGNTVIIRDVRRTSPDATTLTLVGHQGTEHLLEASTDHQNWSLLDVIRFTDSTLTYTNRSDAATTRFYRTSRPDNRPTLYAIQSIRRQPNGQVQLNCLGRPNAGNVVVEISEDMVGWAGIGTFVFTNSAVQFKEPGSLVAQKRFYRLRQ